VDVAQRLSELARLHGTDKGTAQLTRFRWRGRQTLAAKRYTNTYARFFAPFADQPINLLEIGIDRGGSLRLWEDFFPRASIHAIDINPRCVQYASDRVTVYVGSQTDDRFLEGVARESGRLDIVIDDGGHTMEQQLVSLRTLWPHVKPEGFYVIEDTHTSYMTEFGGVGDDSTMSQLKSLLDHLNGHAEANPLIDAVDGIWFATGVAVLRKNAVE
jgi:cephalosporin hydroxylase